MLQKQQVWERDFYYKREITSSDTLKFAGITLLSNLLTYYCMMCFTSLISSLNGSTFYIVLQTICLIPIALFLPIYLINQCVRKVVPRLFSLADNLELWYKKAFRLVFIGEILRFLIGFIPLSITKFGIITSPITYLLYTLFYIEPFEKFDAVVLNNELAFIDVAVFLLIYFSYFLLYDFYLGRKIKKEITRHLKYLQGCLNEKEKYYEFNKRGNT